MLLYKILQATVNSKSIDGNFLSFEIDPNEPVDVGPSTSRALTLQELVIYFDQSAEDPSKYSTIAKFFSPDANPCCECMSVKFAVKVTNERKIQFMTLRTLSIFHVTYLFYILMSFLRHEEAYLE